jgi:hypothetical protein
MFLSFPLNFSEKELEFMGVVFPLAPAMLIPL